VRASPETRVPCLDKSPPRAATTTDDFAVVTRPPAPCHPPRISGELDPRPCPTQDLCVKTLHEIRLRLSMSASQTSTRAHSERPGSRRRCRDRQSPRRLVEGRGPSPRSATLPESKTTPQSPGQAQLIALHPWPAAEATPLASDAGRSKRSEGQTIRPVDPPRPEPDTHRRPPTPLSGRVAARADERSEHPPLAATPRRASTSGRIQGACRP